MSTPERTTTPAPKPTQQRPSEQKQIGTPLSRVEDSPVFNYINNLSPIKPVKSLHITQSFQSLSFPPVPSIFSSPHVNIQVPKFVLRPHISHPPKSDNGDTSQQGTAVSDIPRPLENAVGPNYIRSHPSDEATNLPANEHPIQNNMLSLSLQYNCGSPNHNTAPFYDAKSDTNLDDSSALLIDDLPNGLEESENHTQYDLESESMQHLEQDNNVPECEWKAMISEDARDLLVFDSCTDTEAYDRHSEVLNQDSNVAPAVPRISEETMHIPERTQAEESSQSCLLTVLQDSLGSLDEEAEKRNVTRPTGALFPAEDEKQATKGMELMHSSTGDCIPPTNKVEFKHQRGMLRRCLVFEMAGGNRRNACSDKSEISSTSLSCQGKVSYEEKQKNSQKSRSCPSSSLLPGIGLHLNSLSSTSKDRMLKRDGFLYEEGQIPTQNSVLPFHSLPQNEKFPQVSSSIDDHQCASGEGLGLQVMCEASLEPEIGKGEELNSSSPKKKKRKHESNNESGACKRCNCKKSKCLKLYCECFAAGVYCVEPCTCRDCFNKPIHEDIVLATRKQIESRNPLAFAPKVIRASETALEAGEEANKTPASARHKRGCNCKKSNCLKKYCECYQGGVGCSISCRCEGCKNRFGTKYGKLPVWNEEIEHGDEETDSRCKGSSKLDNPQSISSQNDEQQNQEIMAPITPAFPTFKPSGKPPCPSTGKPPRSTVLIIGSSPRLNAFKALRKSEVLPSQCKSAGHSHASAVDETPDILKSDAPSTSIKVSSPSRKRVSPPHNEKVHSPRYKGSRKLILKSIPSFPSLASETNNDDGPADLTREILNSSPVDMDGAMPTCS